MATKIDNPNLASQAPNVIKIRADSPLNLILFITTKSIKNKHIVIASKVNKTLKKCLYWKHNVKKDLKTPKVLIIII